MTILQHIDPDDVLVSEILTFNLYDEARHDLSKGLVREFSLSINDDDYTADLRVTTWSRNPRRRPADQREDVVDQRALATFNGYDLVKLQTAAAMTLIHLNSHPKKGVDA